MDNEQKAARARRLLHDEHFQSLIAEIREHACTAFLNSALEDNDARTKARLEWAGIEAIQARLQGDLDRETISNKKGQHRGTD